MFYSSILILNVILPSWVNNSVQGCPGSAKEGTSRARRNFEVNFQQRAAVKAEAVDLFAVLDADAVEPKAEEVRAITIYQDKRCRFGNGSS